MKLESLFNGTDAPVFPAPRVTEAFVAVCLIGLAFINTGDNSWWFDVFIVVATLQLASVLIPLVMNYHNEHLCRMFASLLAIAVVGAYIATTLPKLGIGGWILAINFIAFSTLLAVRLAVVVMQNGQPADTGICDSSNERNRGRSHSTHPVHSVHAMVVSKTTGSGTFKSSRTITG